MNNFALLLIVALLTGQSVMLASMGHKINQMFALLRAPQDLKRLADILNKSSDSLRKAVEINKETKKE